MMSNRRARRQFGEAVRLVRQRRGVTMTYLAGQLGVRAFEVDQIECGYVGFSSGLQHQLADALAIPLPVLNLIASNVDSKYEGEQLALVEKLSQVALEQIGAAP